MLTRKPPKYYDFQLKDPPDGLRHVLYLNPENRLEPVEFRVTGSGKAWMAGWFVLQLPDSGIPHGIDFLLNGKRVERLIPDGVPEISGCIGCNTRGFSPEAEVFLESAKTQVLAWLSERLAERLHSWITFEIETQIYQQTVQRLFVTSAAMRRFLSDDPVRRQAVRRLHAFETNHGGRTLTQLVNEAESDRYVKATLALYPQHRLLEGRYAQELIVGLRDHGSRILFDKLAEDLSLGVEFVDRASCWYPDEGKHAGPGHSELERWFLRGLNNSVHANVKVVFWPAKRCENYPFLLLVPAKHDFEKNVNSEEFDRQWTSHATLVVNSESDWVEEIAQVAEQADSHAFEYLPIAIYNVAALLAMANFSQHHQHYFWIKMHDLLVRFRETESQIRELNSLLKEHGGDALRIAELTEEVACLKTELKLRETALDSTRQELAFLLRATGQKIHSRPGSAGAGV